MKSINQIKTTKWIELTMCNKFSWKGKENISSKHKGFYTCSESTIKPRPWSSDIRGQVMRFLQSETLGNSTGSQCRQYIK